jgi:hypothetical protein
MKRAIVHALLWACELHDWLHIDHLTHRHTLAEWSAALDERWNTNVWNPGDDE